MIKYIGLFFIFFAFLLTGFTLIGRLDRRVKFLKSLKALLQQFKIEIAYQIPTVAELFSLNSDSSISWLTDKIAKNLENGMSPKDSVIDVFKCSACANILSKSEKYFLINTISALGTSDAEGQISLLENSIEQLDFYIENAVENKRKNSKVYLTTAVYAGLALVIILL